MRFLILLLALLMPAAALAETSPTLTLAPEVVVRVGPREVTVKDGELSEPEVLNARRRFTGGRLDQFLDDTRRTKMANAIVEAATNHFLQERNVTVTDEELDHWVRHVRALGEENRNRDMARNRDLLEAATAQLAKAEAEADPDQEAIARLRNEQTRLKGVIASLEEAFKLDEQLAELYPGMGRMFLESWLTRKTLVNEFGGRVYIAGGGMEPIDAIESLLKKYEESGVLVFIDDYGREALATYLNRRATLTALSPEEGKERLNQKTW